MEQPYQILDIDFSISQNYQCCILLLLREVNQEPFVLLGFLYTND